MPGDGRTNGQTGLASAHASALLPLQIEIIDYGRGIPSDILPNIFDPFVTNKKDGKGLGLSVVSSGLEEMGANIDVSSDNGSTCFRINFPQGMN